MTAARHKALISLSWVTLGVAIGFLLWSVWSLSWPFRVLDAQPGSWEVQNPGKVVHYGEALFVRYRVCKRMDVASDVTTTLVGRVLVQLPSAEGGLRPGCYDALMSIMVVPPSLPRGEYRVRLSYRYRINALRTVTYNFETDAFQVVP